MEAVAIRNNIVNRGYFKKENEDNLWQTYFEYNNNIYYIAKRTNLTYTEYALSDKDIDFILNSLVKLWNNDFVYEELSKRSKGKIIKLIKDCDEVSFSINKINIFIELNKKDCRRLYAMLKELTIYGKTNKLE